MTDEIKKDVENVQTPVEGQENQKPEAQEPQYTETELKAMEQGWKPLKEWDGDPNDHRSAKEFLDRGELLTKLKSQSTQIRELQQMMNHLSDHNKKVYEAGYKTALTDLQTKRKAAIKEGDFETAVELEEKIDQTKEQLAAVQRAPQPQVQKGPSPIYTDWLSKNKWYAEDAALRHWANGMSVEFGRVNDGVTEQELYDFLHTEVRKLFPQKFKSTPRTPPSPEGSGRKAGGAKGAGSSDEFESIVSEMSELDAKVARDLVKRGYITKEKYIQDFRGGR